MLKLNLSVSRSIFLAIVYLGCHPFSVVAATYYSSPTGSGSTCSNASPCTISGSLTKMSSGDTLILKDGTYTGAANMMSEYAVDPPALPPSGTAGKFTVVKAENVGQAIIDAQYKYPVVSNVNMASRARSYVHFDGIHFRHGYGGVFNFMGTYSKITNCGFEDGMDAASTEEIATASLSGSSAASRYNVIEDCWVWGRGRYGFYFSGGGGSGFGTDHNIMRRVVVRMDSVPPWVSAGIRFYKGSYNVCQNCIVIDGKMDNSSGGVAAFTMGGGSSNGEPYHVWKSVIALNNSSNNGVRGFWTEKVDTLNTISNSIIWGQNSHGMAATSASGTGTLSISKMTIGANAGSQVENNGQLTWNLANSLISVPASRTGFANLDSITNTDIYLASGATAGQTGATSITLASLNAGLKYLPRIEAGSVLATAGVGANILYQEGVSGTYYGQTGWDTTTTTRLWPFANEAVWAAKMKAYTASGPGGNRGFAAVNSTTPLTDYIWGYLGNAKPDIYGGVSGAPVPPQIGGSRTP